MVDSTKYTSFGQQPRSEFDPEWLEKTHQKAPIDPEVLAFILSHDSSAVRDQDKDGYLEIRADALKAAVKEVNPQSKLFPLAPYFADQPKRSFPDRLAKLPSLLREATAKNDFKKARDYFSGWVRKSGNPLVKVAEPLAKYLSASAMHGGVNIEDQTLLEGGSGFSVFGDGRLRFDCALYVQLAHSALQGVPHLHFLFIGLEKNSDGSLPNWQVEIEINKMSNHFYPVPEDPLDDGNTFRFHTPKGLEDHNPSAGHLILLVSDDKNNHLIISNNKVAYRHTADPWIELRQLFAEKYPYYRVGDDYQSSYNAAVKRF